MNQTRELIASKFAHTVACSLAFCLILSFELVLPTAQAQSLRFAQEPLVVSTVGDESALVYPATVSNGAKSLSVSDTQPSDDFLLNADNPGNSDSLSQSGVSVGKTVSTLVRAPYIGIGVGQSDLDPELDAASGFELTDGMQTGWQFSLGMDLSERFSAELHAADFDEAELSNNGSISYTGYGLSALWYFGRNRAFFNREGLNVFARAGVAELSTNVSGGAQFDEIDGVRGLLGGGIEYATHQGLAVRAEGMLFDQDVSYLQVGLIYRFRGVGSWVSTLSSFVGGVNQSGHDRKARMSGASKRTAAPDDGDGDGVLGNDDSCPDTPDGIAVGENGCAIFNGVIEGLTFMAGSAELSTGALVVLESVAASLLQTPSARARVAAHTDSLGAADANMQLSRQRAFEVAKFLVQRGVSTDRLEARAFGETLPIDTNSTPEGRQNNRRVEIDLIAE